MIYFRKQVHTLSLVQCTCCSPALQSNPPLRWGNPNVEIKLVASAVLPVRGSVLPSANPASLLRPSAIGSLR